MTTSSAVFSSSHRCGRHPSFSATANNNEDNYVNLNEPRTMLSSNLGREGNAYHTAPTNVQPVGRILDLGLALGHQRFEVVRLAARDPSGMVEAHARAETKSPVAHVMGSTTMTAAGGRRRDVAPEDACDMTEAIRLDACRDKLREEVEWLRESVDNLGRELVVARRDSGRLAAQLKQEEKLGREQRRRADNAVREATTLKKEVQRLRADARVAMAATSRGTLFNSHDRTMRTAERRRRHRAETTLITNGHRPYLHASPSADRKPSPACWFSLMQAYKGLYEWQLQIQPASAKSHSTLDKKISSFPSAPQKAEHFFPVEPTTASSIAPVTAYTERMDTRIHECKNYEVGTCGGNVRLRTSTSDDGGEITGRRADLLPTSSLTTTTAHHAHAKQQHLDIHLCEQQVDLSTRGYASRSNVKDAKADGSGENAGKASAAMAAAAATVPASVDALAVAATSRSGDDVSRCESAPGLEGIRECARGLVLGTAATKQSRKVGVDCCSGSSIDSSLAISPMKKSAGNTNGVVGNARTKDEGYWGLVDTIGGNTRDQARSRTCSDLTAETLACSPVEVVERVQNGQAEHVWVEYRPESSAQLAVATYTRGLEETESSDKPGALEDREQETNIGNFKTPNMLCHRFQMDLSEDDMKAFGGLGRSMGDNRGDSLT